MWALKKVKKLLDWPVEYAIINIMNKYLKHAIKCGTQHDYDDFLDYQLCAVIVRGGNIVSVGYNKRNTNGFVEHYIDRVKPTRNYCMNTHAEMDAVAQARSKTDLRGCKIFVARIKKPGSHDGRKIGIARPCQICQNVLLAYGIRKAYYTIDDNNYGVMKVIHHTNPEHTDKEFCTIKDD